MNVHRLDYARMNARREALAKRKRKLPDTVRDELRELTIHKANYEEMLDLANREQYTRKERDRQ